MIPSLIQLVQPAYSSKRKRRRHVVDRTNEKSMDDFAANVRRLFEAPLPIERLYEISAKLQEEYKEKLRSSNISMLPSYMHTLPTGNEQGDFLALDVGGSTLRVALIRLAGKRVDGDGLQVRRIRSFAIDEKIRQLTGRMFFDWMAARIGEMLKEHNHMNGTVNARLQLGLAWSFPVEQTGPRTGRLLAMGKGFKAAVGLEGEDLGGLIMEACLARGLNVEVCAIVNDGPAALLSKAYRDPATRMSLILGTGMNAAVFLPVSSMPRDKFGVRPDSWHTSAQRVVVNTEISMFGKKVLPITKWDEDLNANHRLPDFQPLEYLITGRYLGEILRLIILEAISTIGLFGGQIPERLDVPYAFETRTLAIFESDRTPDLSSAGVAFHTAHPMRSPPKLHELEFIRDIGRLASRRAAAYLATSLHALWAVRTAAEGIEPGEASHVTIACDGSMVEKYPGFRQCTQRYLDRLCMLSGASEGAVTLDLAPESSIFGAAVAVACMVESN
jgi:hexokinase